MLNSFYAAATGMELNMSKMDVISNNTANIDTPGFKKAIAVTASFSNQLNQQMNGTVNSAEKVGAYINEIKTDFSDGSQMFTGDQYDFSLATEGFFTIETPQGIAYTRNGSFATNGDGYLVTKSGYRVLGEGGPIKVDGYKDITVTENGVIKGDGKPIDTMLISNFPKPYQMIRAGSTLFYPENTQAAFQVDRPEVRQRYLESSNITQVSIMAEMINMLDCNRHFEANQRIISMQDQILSKTVNEIAKT